MLHHSRDDLAARRGRRDEEETGPRRGLNSTPVRQAGRPKGMEASEKYHKLDRDLIYEAAFFVGLVNGPVLRQPREHGNDTLSDDGYIDRGEADRSRYQYRLQRRNCCMRRSRDARFGEALEIEIEIEHQNISKSAAA